MYGGLILFLCLSPIPTLLLRIVVGLRFQFTANWESSDMCLQVKEAEYLRNDFPKGKQKNLGILTFKSCRLEFQPAMCFPWDFQQILTEGQAWVRWQRYRWNQPWRDSDSVWETNIYLQVYNENWITSHL